MIDLSTTLLHGFLICLLFSAFAFITFWLRPRWWLHSLPPDIQHLAKPKTDREKRLTKSVLLPLYLLILPGLSVASTIYITTTSPTNVTFIGMLGHLYAIWIIVHLWDFLLIDCVATIIINPDKPPIAGTEGAKGWKDYTFHFKAFLRAVVMSALFVAPCAGSLYWILC